MKFWLHGLSWLNIYPVKFPSYNLECLNKNQKVIVQANVVDKLVCEPIMSFDRFLDFNKLLKATSFVFKIRNKIKK